MDPGACKYQIDSQEDQIQDHNKKSSRSSTKMSWGMIQDRFLNLVDDFSAYQANIQHSPSTISFHYIQGR